LVFFASRLGEAAAAAAFRPNRRANLIKVGPLAPCGASTRYATTAVKRVSSPIAADKKNSISDFCFHFLAAQHTDGSCLCLGTDRNP
jgi:hypothetical protein